MDPFEYEIELKLKGVGRPRGGKLPYLYPWQYKRELYSDDNFYQMINSYKNWVYVAASKNATTAANVPLRLYVAKNKKGQKLKGYPTRSVGRMQEKSIREDAFLQNIPSVRKASEFEELTDHPFLDLMRNVNGFMGLYDLKELTQLYQELTGNCFWHVLNDRLGVPREIWVVPPQNMRILPDKQKFIAGYQYEKGSDTIDLKEKDIIHFKFVSPKSAYYGHSPYLSIAEEFGLHSSINQYEDAMFKNFGAISGVFETDETLGDHEFERLKLEIQQSFSGAKNAGKTPLLDNGLKYKPIGTSPKEMSHLKGRDTIRESILNAYGQALGMYSKEANRANVEAAVYQYMKFTIAPRLARTQEKINEKLIWRYDDKVFVKFDDCVPDDKEFKLNERIKHVQTSVASVDEEREKLGLNSLGGIFSEPFIPVNYQTQEGVLANIANGTGKGNIISDPKQLKELLNK